MATNLQLETKMKIKPDQLKEFFGHNNNMVLSFAIKKILPFQLRTKMRKKNFDLHDKIYKGFLIDYKGWFREKGQQYGAKFNSLNWIYMILGSAIFSNLRINYINHNY